LKSLFFGQYGVERRYVAGAVHRQQGQVLRESLDALLDRGTEMSKAFFDALFDTHPDFRESFALVDLPGQHTAFLAALKYVANHYEQRAALERNLRELGARHAGYGMRPDHFADFGACLLDTMAQFAGPAWTLEVDLAWRTAFEHVAEMMVEGAADARAASAARAG